VHELSEPRVIGIATDSFSKWKGLQQGCLMSQVLFSLYADETSKGGSNRGCIKKGVQIVSYRLKSVSFADDQGMVASTRNGLQKIMGRLNYTDKNTT